MQIFIKDKETKAVTVDNNMTGGQVLMAYAEAIQDSNVIDYLQMGCLIYQGKLIRCDDVLLIKGISELSTLRFYWGSQKQELSKDWHQAAEQVSVKIKDTLNSKSGSPSYSSNTSCHFFANSVEKTIEENSLQERFETLHDWAEASKHYKLLSYLKTFQENYKCPITREIMTDPVEIDSGKIFEATAIRHYLKDPKQTTCPVSKQLLRDKSILPQYGLKSKIAEELQYLEQLKDQTEKITLDYDYFKF